MLQALEDPELDLIYVYCHARGGIGDPDKTSPPKLECFDPVTGVLRYASGLAYTLYAFSELRVGMA